MDAKNVVKEFQKLKVVTIEEVVGLLESSVITARRQLKKWRAYTSFNMNGRYYTLPEIPRFDEHGIWKYQQILFSRYGNLMQTISQLIGRSEKGLNARQIAQVVEIAPNSSVFSRLQSAPGIRREKHQGRFVYFSEEKYRAQREGLSGPEHVRFPSNTEAVIILVQRIKYPHNSIEELSERVSEQGTRIESHVIHRFLDHHGLLKKNPATK
ncbi:MAG TPA: hypothetical protein VKA69_07580 [Desulfobacteria bacterium]|nr:hypothetical protein [Desulfobacteria bacterium]